MKRLSTLLICFALSYVGSVMADGIADRLVVENPMVRAVAPGTPVSGAYMTVRNQSGADHILVSAHSNVAKSVEIHNHTSSDGVMKMRRVDQVSVPAGSETVFEPGGFHIMLIGLNRSLNAGARIDIALEFEDGSRRKVSFPVR